MQAKITSLGLVTFLDEGGIKYGDDFENIILAELKTSHELVVLLTPWSLMKPYIWMEVGAAWALNVRIIIVLYGLTLQEVTANTEIPVVLKKNNLLNINDFDKYIDQLTKRVS